MSGTSTSGACGKTSNCRTASCSFPASSATPPISSSIRRWWPTASCATPRWSAARTSSPAPTAAWAAASIRRSPGRNCRRLPKAPGSRPRSCGTSASGPPSTSLLLLLLGDLVQHRLPGLLLLVNERRGLGRRHRIRVAAELGEFRLQLRLGGHLAQVIAHLLDDGCRRGDRRDQDRPAGGAKARNGFRHGGQVGKLSKTLGRGDGDQLDRARL